MLSFVTPYAQKTFSAPANIPICMLSVTSNETAHWKSGHKLPLAFMNMCPLSFSTWHCNVLLSSSAGEKASHYQQPLEIKNVWGKLIWIWRISALASFSHYSVLKSKRERSFSPSLFLEIGLCIFTATCTRISVLHIRCFLHCTLQGKKWDRVTLPQQLQEASTH